MGFKKKTVVSTYSNTFYKRLFYVLIMYANIYYIFILKTPKINKVCQHVTFMEMVRAYVTKRDSPGGRTTGITNFDVMDSIR